MGYWTRACYNCRADELIPFFTCIMFIVIAISCSPNLNVLKPKTTFRKK